MEISRNTTNYGTAVICDDDFRAAQGEEIENRIDYMLRIAGGILSRAEMREKREKP